LDLQLYAPDAVSGGGFTPKEASREDETTWSSFPENGTRFQLKPAPGMSNVFPSSCFNDMESLQTIENLHNPIFQTMKGVEGQFSNWLDTPQEGSPHQRDWTQPASQEIPTAGNSSASMLGLQPSGAHLQSLEYQGYVRDWSTAGETPTFSNNNSQPVPATDASPEVGIKEEPDIECMIPVKAKDDSESELPLVSEASDEVDEIVDYDTCFGVVSLSARPWLPSIRPSSYLTF